MTTITFDSDQLVIELEATGIPREQARAVVRAIIEAQTDLATKRDIATLASKIDMQEMELRLVKWVFGVALGQVAVIAALVKLL
jgi:hypothetical protein